MIACPKCGYDNELGRIFCHSCGTKLDLTQIRPPGQGGKKLRKPGGSTKIVRRALDVVILAVLGVVIYLLAQVPEVKVPKPTQEDLAAVDGKLAELEQLLASPQAAMIEVKPGEFNAFLNQGKFSQQSGSGAVKPLVMYAEFGKGEVTMVFLGEFNLGPITKKIYVTYTGRPVADGKEFVFKPTGGQIGAMPIAVGIMETTGLVKNWFGTLLGGLKTEKGLLDRVSRIQVTPERALLIHQPAK